MSEPRDSLRRDDMKSWLPLSGLPADIQAALLRAASRGRAKLPSPMADQWFMVPSKRGLRQVAVSGTRAFRL